MLTRIVLAFLFAAVAGRLGAAVPELADYRPLATDGQTRTVFFDDFEKERQPWRGFYKNYQILKGEGLTGSHGLVFTRQPGEKYRFISLPLALEKGKRYRLSAMVRAEGILTRNGKTKNDKGGELRPNVIGVEFHDSNKWLSGNIIRLQLKDGNADWTELSTEFSMPEAAERASLAVFLQNIYSCRQVTWDNICIEELGEETVLIYPVLPKMLLLGPDGALKFQLYTAVGLKNEKALRLFASWKGGYQAAPVRDGAAEFRLGKLPSGRHEIKLQLADTAAKKIVAEEVYPFTVPAGPTPDYAVAVDESGRLTVDNKPFFPVGIFFERPKNLTEEALENLREAGINMITPYYSLSMRLPDDKGKIGLESVRNSLDLIARYDLKVLFSLLQLSKTFNQTVENFDGLADPDRIAERLIPGIADHPALLGYYISDENPLNELDIIRNLRFKVSGLDPYRPTVTLTNIPANYPNFAPTGDLLMMDKYPISTDKDQSMAKIRECFESRERNCRLGAWFAPQAFNWGIYQKGRKYDEFRYPTEQEIRSQCLLALNFRIRGICFYAYESIFIWQERRDPGSVKWFWPQVTKVTKLLRELEPFFLADAAPAAVKLTSTGASKVEAKLHTANDGKQLVVVTADGPGTGAAVLDVGVDGLKSRFGFTRPLGGGRYKFKAENIAADILEP